MRVSRLQSDVSTSGYFTDEESDDSHISLDESLVFMIDDLESDGKMILVETHKSFHWMWDIVLSTSRYAEKVWMYQ